jgi:predicted membrane protein
VERDRLEDRWSRHRFHSGASGILIGGVIVAIGLGLLLDNLDIIHFHDVWRFWPLALVVWGVSRLLESRSAAGYVWGGLVILVGAIFLLDNFHILIFEFNPFEVIWPLLIIGFGASMLLRAMDRKRYLDGVPPATANDLGHFVIFSGVKRRVESQDFKGGDIVAIFGGVNIDLRRASIASDRAVIDVNALFGGVDIRVPDNWRVSLKGMGVFGAFEDKTVPPKPDPNVKTPELVVTGAALFGGVKVDN